MKPSKGEKAFNVINLFFLILISFTMLYPFMYTLSMSFSTLAEASRRGLHLFPREVSLTAYKMVFKNKMIFTTYGNTVFRTIVGTTLTLVVTSLYAYALSRPYMPCKRMFTFILLFTMLFNGGTIPTYLVIKNLYLIDNRMVYVLTGLISTYNVIVMRKFFENIPESLPESAKIDGANEFLIFSWIIVPLSKPVIATVALWVAVNHWNAWFDSMLYINTPSKQVVQIYLQRIIQENNPALISQGLINPDVTDFTPETIKSATIIVTILPILCVYPFIQKYFVKGIMLGSVKG